VEGSHALLCPYRREAAPVRRVILLPPEGSPPEMAERTNAQRRLLLRHLRGLPPEAG